MIALLCGILLTATASASSDIAEVSASWIHDGDTFRVTVLNRAVVDCRLWGIDAPELDQPWGKVSRSALIALLIKRKLTITKVSESYNRMVVKADRRGVDVALFMLKMGLAWADKKYSPPEDYIKAEAEARAEKRGLWSEKKPIPPWEWRNRKKDNASKEKE